MLGRGRLRVKHPGGHWNAWAQGVTGASGVCSLSSNAPSANGRPWAGLGAPALPRTSALRMTQDTPRSVAHRRRRLDAVPPGPEAPPGTPSLLTSVRRPPSPSPPDWGRVAAARGGALRPGAPGPGAPAAAAPAGPALRRRTRGLQRSGAGAAGPKQVSEGQQSAGPRRCPRAPPEALRPRPGPGVGGPWPHLF